MRAGDTDAYAVLVRRHAAVAMRTAALLGAGSDTEDVVQEALVKAYRSLGRFRLDRRPPLAQAELTEAVEAINEDNPVTPDGRFVAKDYA